MKILRATASVCAILMCLGCVTQRTYDLARGEADRLGRSLAGEQGELQEMEQELAALQRSARAAESELAQVHAAMNKTLEEASLARQRADDRLAALQTQVAFLVNQSRGLRRELAEAKQENASLQASVSQYKSDLEGLRMSASSTPITMPPPTPGSIAPPPDPAPVPTATAAPAVPAPTVPTVTPPAPPTPADGDVPVKPITTRPTKPSPDDDSSWTGLIKSWVSSIWEWIFG